MTYAVICRLCEDQKKSRSELYNHYSMVHYKEDLVSLIDRKTLRCQFCEVQRNKIDTLVRHLGSVHDKVEDFLPPEFHLPRSSARRYSQKSTSPDELSQTSGTSDHSHREEGAGLRTIDPDMRNIRDIFDSDDSD